MPRAHVFAARRRAAAGAAWTCAGACLLAVAAWPAGCADPSPAPKETSLSNQAIAAVDANLATAASPAPAAMACAGTPTECNGITDANTCNQQNGCGWTGAFCFSPSCGDYSDQTTCEAKACRWAQFCGGTAQPCVKSSQESFCNARAGCQWGGGVCTGAPKYCSALTDDPAGCRAQLGCDADVGCIEAGAVRCIDFGDSASCQAGPRCAWQTAQCTGAVLPCGMVGDANACAEQAGCRWGEAK